MINDLLASSARAEDVEEVVGAEALVMLLDESTDFGYIIPTFALMHISDVEGDRAYAWDDVTSGAIVVDPGDVFLRRDDLHEVLVSVGEVDAEIIDEEREDATGVPVAAHAIGARGDHARPGCSLADMLSHAEGLLCSVFDDGEAEAFVPVFFDDECGTWRCVASGLEREVESRESDSHVIVEIGEGERAAEWMCEKLADHLRG